MMKEMAQSLNDHKDSDRLNLIVRHAMSIGFITPFIPWAWSELLIPLKLSPIAFKQVFAGVRPISSLLLPFGLILFLVGVNIIYMLLLNRLRKDFITLYKEEANNFRNSPIKTLIALTKTTLYVSIFGGSAFLTSKFFVFH